MCHRIDVHEVDEELVRVIHRDGVKIRSSLCEVCPWRTERKTGDYPAALFREAAETARDGSTTAFGCLDSPDHSPEVCVGYVLRQGRGSAIIRTEMSKGTDFRQTLSVEAALYPHFRAMAVANGVAADDPALHGIRDDAQLMGDFGVRTPRYKEKRNEDDV